MKCYTAKVFMTGRSQAIRLPKECRIKDAKIVKICRDGDRLYIEPLLDSWGPILEAIDSFPDEFELQRSPTDKTYKDIFE
jgi:antitoxin VapB